MRLSEIIGGADTLVPNAFTDVDKVSWLNAINQDFFSVVKIPKIEKVSTIARQSEYTLKPDVRTKNIDLVQDSFTQYRSLMGEGVRPTENFWMFDDDLRKITISPAPFKSGNTLIVRYHRVATTTFVHNRIANDSPDAPLEYHWIYVVGLCAKISKAQDDIPKATNYENEFTAALNNAAAEFQGGVR